MKLEDVCEVYSGYALKEFNNENNGLPIIKIGNILSDGTVDIDTCQYSAEIVNEKYYSKANDIYVALSGATTGKIGIIQTEKKYIINQRVGIVRKKDNDIPSEFIKYFLLKQTGRILQDAAGCAQPNISPKQIGQYEFPQLDISAMHHIARILNILNTIITQRNKELKGLDNLIKARFVEMFGTGDFHSVALKEITEVITKGTTPTTAGFDFVDDGVNFFKIESIMEDHTINLNKVAHVTEECHRAFKRSQLRTGDILFSIAGAIGRTAIITERDLPGNTNQALAIIRLLRDSGLSRRFLISSFESPLVIEQYNRKKRGIAQINLSLQDIGNLIIPVPDKNAQDEFERFVHQVDKSKFAVQKSLDETQLLFDSLMQEYFG